MKARPTVYNGIQMRSRLEARVAAWLDSLDVSWTYEPRAFASAAGQYLPDFQLATDTHTVTFPATRPVYLEVKGYLDNEGMYSAEQVAEIITASEPNAIVLISDASMFEAGLTRVVGYPNRGDWANELIVNIFVLLGVAGLCEHWRLPPWNAT